MKDWTCKQSGCCCKAAGVVVMTPGEFRAVQARDPRPVTVTGTGDGRIEVSRDDGAIGCPYYEDGCQVYAVRPGVCRGYGCFRRPGEPYTDTGMLTRLQESAGVRRVALKLYEDAEAWTNAHP